MLIRQGPFASLIPIPNFMLGTQLTRQLGHYAGKAIKSLIKENFIYPDLDGIYDSASYEFLRYFSPKV
jgi:hypothetical protein